MGMIPYEMRVTRLENLTLLSFSLQAQHSAVPEHNLCTQIHGHGTQKAHLSLSGLSMMLKDKGLCPLLQRGNMFTPRVKDNHNRAYL
jgi:hypothetical protein